MVVKLGFDDMIVRLSSCFDRRNVFVTMRREKSDKYKELIRYLKHDDTRTRKCECPYKLHGYLKVNNIFIFNVVYCIHNHDLCYNLVGYSTVFRMNFEENKFVPA